MTQSSTSPAPQEPGGESGTFDFPACGIPPWIHVSTNVGTNPVTDPKDKPESGQN